jgi:hypothetical protein
LKSDSVELNLKKSSIAATSNSKRYFLTERNLSRFPEKEGLRYEIKEYWQPILNRGQLKYGNRKYDCLNRGC